MESNNQATIKSNIKKLRENIPEINVDDKMYNICTENSNATM